MSSAGDATSDLSASLNTNNEIKKTRSSNKSDVSKSKKDEINKLLLNEDKKERDKQRKTNKHESKPLKSDNETTLVHDSTLSNENTISKTINSQKETNSMKSEKTSELNQCIKKLINNSNLIEGLKRHNSLFSKTSNDNLPRSESLNQYQKVRKDAESTLKNFMEEKNKKKENLIFKPSLSNKSPSKCEVKRRFTSRDERRTNDNPVSFKQNRLSHNFDYLTSINDKDEENTPNKSKQNDLSDLSNKDQDKLSKNISKSVDSGLPESNATPTTTGKKEKKKKSSSSKVSSKANKLLNSTATAPSNISSTKQTSNTIPSVYPNVVITSEKKLFTKNELLKSIEKKILSGNLNKNSETKLINKSDNSTGTDSETDSLEELNQNTKNLNSTINNPTLLHHSSNNNPAYQHYHHHIHMRHLYSSLGEQDKYSSYKKFYQDSINQNTKNRLYSDYYSYDNTNEKLNSMNSSTNNGGSKIYSDAARFYMNTSTYYGNHQTTNISTGTYPTTGSYYHAKPSTPQIPPRMTPDINDSYSLRPPTHPPPAPPTQPPPPQPQTRKHHQTCHHTYLNRHSGHYSSWYDPASNQMHQSFI
jgi:hypothetical protein